MNERNYKLNRMQRKKRRRIVRMVSAAMCLTLIAGFTYIWSVKHSKNNLASAYEGDDQMPESALSIPKAADDKALPAVKAPDDALQAKVSTPVKDVPATPAPKDDKSSDLQDTSVENGTAAPYEYGTPLPESQAVGSEYFDDAVFIGNSHTEGIISYSAMDNATVYASKGITIDAISTKPVIKTDAGRITIPDALSQSKFGKVYILLGANELGWVYPSEFIKHYAAFIESVKELQPDAKIYVQSIFPVSAEKDSEGTVYNNSNINNFNSLIMEMAKDKEVYYLNVAEALSDEKGNLPEDCAKDGMHFGKKYYDKWFDYLKSHTAEGLTKDEEAQ